MDIITSLSALQLAGLTVALGVSYAAVRIIYNLFISPLSRFPGPKLAAISHVWYAIHWTGGKYHQDVAALHAKYGNIVRVAPNELSFATVESYKTIYGHASKGRRPFLKSLWFHAEDAEDGLASVQDPIKHQTMRKSLSHAFSPKAMKLQSDLVIKYIDLFVQQLTKYGDQEKGIPMQEWFNWLTFDVIGDLAFGEPFGAVAAAKPQFWISTILNGVHAISLGDLQNNRMRLLKVLSPLFNLVHRDALSTRKTFLDLSRQKAKKRLAQGNDREDFFAHVIADKNATITEEYIEAQATTFIVAGSETTATGLSGIAYYLTTTPLAMQRLKQEIRDAFQSTEAITTDSTASLQYLVAVIEEGLRIFGPAPFGLPRVCPGAEIDGEFIPPGTIVHTSPWTTQHASKHWHEPSEFHPERWLPADHQWHDAVFDDDVKEASKPFSTGPRACLGVNLAYMEMRMVLAKLIWHFDWELIAKDLNWDRDTQLFTLWKKPELMIRFRPVVR